MTQEQYYWYVLRPQQLKRMVAGYAENENFGPVPEPTMGGVWYDSVGTLAGLSIPYKEDYEWDLNSGSYRLNLVREGTTWTLECAVETTDSVYTTTAAEDATELSFDNGRIVIKWASITPPTPAPTVGGSWSESKTLTSLHYDTDYKWISNGAPHSDGFVLYRIDTTWHFDQYSAGSVILSGEIEAAENATDLLFNIEGGTTINFKWFFE